MESRNSELTPKNDRLKRRADRIQNLKIEGYRVRYVKPEDIPKIELLAKTAFFDVGVETMAMFYDHYPPGWELIEDKGGEIVAFAALMKLKNGAHFGNIIVVKDELRNKGLIRMFVNDGKTDVACATKHSLTKIAYPLYLGKVVVFAGILKSYKRISADHPPTVQIHKLAPQMLPGILDYDRSIAPIFERGGFLEEWITAERHPLDTWCTVAVENNTVKGFAVVRAYPRGAFLMPVYADTPEIAESLVRKLAKIVPIGSIILAQGFAYNQFIHQLARALDWQHLDSEYCWRNEKGSAKEVFENAKFDKMFFTHEWFPY